MRNNNLWVIPNPCKHMKELCKELGDKYIIRIIDLEQVIYRDFGNGYNVEISGMNHNSKKCRATLYLWEGYGRTVKIISDVPQGNIGDRVEELYAYTKKLIKEKKGESNHV